MALRFKATAKGPKSLYICAGAHNARLELGLIGDTYVTSLNDSRHMQGSLHYLDRAADFRTRDLTPLQVVQWAAAIRKRLGPDYDIVIESDHLHVEFDPLSP